LSSAPDPTGEAYNAPPDSLAGLRGGAPRERERGKRGEKGEGKGEEGVPECPNSELASLFFPLFLCGLVAEW